MCVVRLCARVGECERVRVGVCAGWVLVWGVDVGVYGCGCVCPCG